MMRRGLAALISGESDLAVCGEAADRKQALAEIARTKPAVVIVDLSLERSDGMELLRDVKKLHPDLPALVVSMHDESLFAERAFRAGARGYVCKHEMGDTVLVAIRRLLAGERHMSARMSARLAENFLERRKPAEDSPLAALTDRETQVFRLIGSGHPTREIAKMLNLSVKTIETHREHIKAKLGLPSGAALIRHAFQLLGQGQAQA